MKPVTFRKPYIGPARGAIGHMPFKGHRTQAEVRDDEEYFVRFTEREGKAA